MAQDAGFQTTTRVSQDAEDFIWQAIRAEAIEASRDEPVLASY